MRIRRIGLANYRGVAAREVELLPDGTTTGVAVVEGPNEIGKSSMADAIRHILGFYDDSKHREIRALKPVDRDVGTEITLDVECGDCAFTYFKRFNKSTETRLHVSRPEPQRLTGREAHERVRAILDASIDVHLWEALHIQQGAAVEQASVGDTYALQRVLGGAEGTTAIGERELGLWQRAQGEHERYFTKTGRERKALTAQDEALAQARKDLEEVEATRVALERDVERIDELEHELPVLRARVRECEERTGEQLAALRHVEALERTVEHRRLADEAARSRADRAREHRTARDDLVADVNAARARLADLDIDGSDQERVRRATDDAEACLAALTEARSAAHAADHAASVRAADVEHLVLTRELEDLRDRHARVSQAVAVLADVQARLSEIRVDTELVERLRSARMEVQGTAAALGTSSPRLELRAHAAVELDVDGQPTKLVDGEVFEQTVTGLLTVGVPGVGQVRVEAGGGVQELAVAHRRAERALAELLAEGGVADVAEAERADERRREMLVRHAEAQRMRTEALGGDSLEQLTHRLASAQRRVDDYRGGRPADPPMAEEIEQARALRDAATAAASSARAACGEAEEAELRARRCVEAVREEERSRRVDLAVAEDALERLTGQLERARAQVSDTSLGEDLAAAERDESATARQLHAARAELDAADPDAVRAFSDNAREAADGARSRLRDAEDELHGLRSRVEVRGGQGLFDEREQRVAALEHLEREQRTLRRRAAAAKRLHDELTTCREAARQRYVEPLREQIVRLCRLLTPDHTVDVELDEDLRISRRIIDGVPLELSALSVGAREQLALIARVACAMLVSKDHGGPLLIDDSLGYSDPARLEAMGAVLRLAGQHCQIVVLTCYPDRYRHVGGAHHVSLR